MKTSTLNTEALLAALSSLAGFPLQLPTLQTASGKPANLICPPNLADLTQPFWQAVRASETQGIWEAPKQAMVGFASQMTGWLAALQGPRRRTVDDWLKGQLTGGALAASSLATEAAGCGISRDRLGRAARRLGVVRRKDGMRGGWLRELPAGKPGTATPAEQREGMV